MGMFRICAWYLPLDHKEKKKISAKKRGKSKNKMCLVLVVRPQRLVEALSYLLVCLCRKNRKKLMLTL